jgi:hypothetical protein
VRAPEQNRALAADVFGEVAVEVRQDLLRIPYSHCILQMRSAAH